MIRSPGKNVFKVPDERVDERDTMFARAARQADSQPYEDYYNRNKDLKKIDDKLRKLPPLLSPDGRYYNDHFSKSAGQYFDNIPLIKISEEDLSLLQYCIQDKDQKKLKNSLLKLGAVAVGFTDLPIEFIYTHHGRNDRNYGDIISNNHKTTIVFLVEMKHRSMQRAPFAEVINESAKQYYRAAVIAKTLEDALIKSGYSATANFDANYELILPPLAVKAGLGELGRNNILVADKYGSRVRIGAVSTDLDLKHDYPVHLGVQAFCTICKKCSENCPSHSLSNKEKTKVRGIEKWPTHVESCYGYWRTIGTDCGICMTVCPFSHKNNWFHNSVRFLLKHLRILHKPALYFDDLLFGRKWKNLS